MRLALTSGLFLPLPLLLFLPPRLVLRRPLLCAPALDAFPIATRAFLEGAVLFGAELTFALPFAGGDCLGGLAVSSLGPSTSEEGSDAGKQMVLEVCDETAGGGWRGSGWDRWTLVAR